MRLSGLQREALALYRKCLRESRKKPAVCNPDSFPEVYPLTMSQRKQRYTFRSSLGIIHILRVAVGANPQYRQEFEKNIGLNKKDFTAIEYLLRKGNRQLEMYASPGIKDIFR